MPVTLPDSRPPPRPPVPSALLGFIQVLLYQVLKLLQDGQHLGLILLPDAGAAAGSLQTAPHAGQGAAPEAQQLLQLLLQALQAGQLGLLL